MKNKKPKYWVVRNDESQLFKDTVIKKMNEINDDNEPWKGKGHYFYGYNGQRKHDGTFASHDLDRLENNPTLLTLEEFIELFIEEEDIKAGYTVLVRDFDVDNWQKGTYIATLDKERAKIGMFIAEVKGVVAVHWKQMKKIPVHTMEELTKIVGYDFEIKD